MFALFSMASFAECKLTPICWNNGLFTFSASDVATGTATVTLIDATGNPITGIGAYSATITVINSSLLFTVPQPVRTTVVRVKVVWHNNKVNTEYTTTKTCTNLPVKLYDINANRAGDSITLSFTSDDEINVGYYKVSVSFDGINWQERLLLFPKIDSAGKYIVTIKK